MFVVEGGGGNHKWQRLRMRTEQTFVEGSYNSLC